MNEDEVRKYVAEHTFRYYWGGERCFMIEASGILGTHRQFRRRTQEELADAVIEAWTDKKLREELLAFAKKYSEDQGCNERILPKHKLGVFILADVYGVCPTWRELYLSSYNTAWVANKATRYARKLHITRVEHYLFTFNGWLQRVKKVDATAYTATSDNPLYNAEKAAALQSEYDEWMKRNDQTALEARRTLKP